MTLQYRNKMILLAILGMCMLPILLAQLAWQWARPQGGSSFGQLLAQPLLEPATPPVWQLLAYSQDGCGTQSHELAQWAGQLQKAQGRVQERIRVAACPSLPPSMQSGIYLIDPHGNAVLRYTPMQLAEAGGRQAALREIGRVLKNNPGL